MNPTLISPYRRPLLVFLITLLGGSFAATKAVAAYSFGTGAANDRCLACHGSEAAVGKRYHIDRGQYGHTTHASFGCTTCHETVRDSHPGGEPVSQTTTCRDCHDTIAADFRRDAHAARTSCGGCHNPHRVARPDEMSGEAMNRQCGGCHRKSAAIASHSRWLPQAGLHMGAIACVTCHSRAENHVVTIYLVHRNGGGDVPARYEELRQLAGSGPLQDLVDRNRDNYISIKELQLFNRDPAHGDLSLKGMITPVKPTHSFVTFDNRWNCTFCHAKGPGIMQTSFVAFPEENGTFRQVAVEKGAVIEALHTVPNFYLTGSTRNPLLDRIGLAIIAGGMIMPVGHGFLRFLTRKFRG